MSALKMGNILEAAAGGRSKWFLFKDRIFLKDEFQKRYVVILKKTPTTTNQPAKLFGW